MKLAASDVGCHVTVPEEGVPVTVKPAGGGPAGFIAVLARVVGVTALPGTDLRTPVGAATTGVLGTSTGVTTTARGWAGGAAGGAEAGAADAGAPDAGAPDAADAGDAGGLEDAGGAVEAVLPEGVVTLMLVPYEFGPLLKPAMTRYRIAVPAGAPASVYVVPVIFGALRLAKLAVPMLR
ncbi:MAG TPA: hypothetical protein VNO19_13170 [Gemmatimonadales bacterium]|nr:hypothetical protein [Gemmatimonadales bacterium]